MIYFPLTLLSLILVFAPCGNGQQIRTIDVEEVILQYKKTREITESLEKRIQAEMEIVRQSRRALQEKYAALELTPFDEGNPESLLERLKREKELALEEVDIENREKSQRLLREREIVDHMKKVYAEVLKEIEIYAASQGGIGIVLLVNSRPIEANSRNGVSSEILIKQVVWRDLSLDITAEIVRRLNR